MAVNAGLIAEPGDIYLKGIDSHRAESEFFLFQDSIKVVFFLVL